MHAENTIDIDAGVDRVFALGAEVENWPVLLSHYRYVRVLGGAADRDPIPRDRTVEMAANRSGIPVRWTSTQRLLPDEGRIVYRHVRGITRGMDVVWEIDPLPGGSRVRIIHALEKPAGLLRLPGGTWLAGDVFIRHIADQTLRGIKLAAEQAGGLRP